MPSPAKIRMHLRVYLKRHIRRHEASGYLFFGHGCHTDGDGPETVDYAFHLGRPGSLLRSDTCRGRGMGLATLPLLHGDGVLGLGLARKPFPGSVGPGRWLPRMLHRLRARPDRLAGWIRVTVYGEALKELTREAAPNYHSLALNRLQATQELLNARKQEH